MDENTSAQSLEVLPPFDFHYGDSTMSLSSSFPLLIELLVIEVTAWPNLISKTYSLLNPSISRV